MTRSGSICHSGSVGRNYWRVRFRAPSIDGTRQNIFREARFLHFDGFDYLAGARQALLEKFATEFLSRIGGDNFVDGFLHGSRIPLG
jgi:hypothetical protein